ncbi:MAG: HNH endonuclease [Chitinophagales bacterium]
MIQLVSKDISDNAKDRLADLQSRVNLELTFVNKASRAKSFWNGKSGSIIGRTTFEEIKSVLETMCVSIEVCNYCEQNEANDIEHIAPKSFFPELAFIWENYLLACKQCNSGYKLDKCYVLDDNGELQNIERGSEPAYKTLAFINPRIENPNDFLILNMETYQFEYLPNLDTNAQYKAEKTLEILQLNSRDTLIQARRNAAIYYYSRIERLVHILEARNIEEIELILTPYDDAIDPTIDLQILKEQIKNGFKKDIQTHQHPSVWYAIKKIQRIVDRRWAYLFEQLPETLDW